MKVKLFNSPISIGDLENQIAEWTKDLNPHIYSIKITTIPLHDVYTAPENPLHGKMCNSWIEYIVTISYDTKLIKSNNNKYKNK